MRKCFFFLYITKPKWKSFIHTVANSIHAVVLCKSHLINKNCWVYEYFAQYKMSGQIDWILKKSCPFEFTGADGLGMFPILLELLRIRREIEFMDNEQAFEIFASFLQKKQGKMIVTKFFKKCRMSKNF